MKYKGIEVLIDDLNGNMEVVNNYLEIESDNIQKYMNQNGYYFFDVDDDDDNYEKMIFMKQNCNQHSTSRIILQEVQEVG